MLVAVFLGAKVPFRVHRLTALRAKRATARGYLHTPAGQGANLGARAPKADHASFLSGLTFSLHFPRHQHNQIVLCIVSQANFAHAEKRIDRWVYVHLFFDEVTGSHIQVGIFGGDLIQELFYTNSQGLDLNFLDNQGNRPVALPALQVKDALAGLADGIGHNMGDRAEIDFYAWHGLLQIDAFRYLMTAGKEISEA
jgi:hypothetical protein